MGHPQISLRAVTTHMVSDPQTARDILRHRAFRVDNPLRKSRLLFGASVLDTEGKRHQMKKKEWSLGFARSHVARTYGDVVQDSVRDGFALAHDLGDLWKVCALIPNLLTMRILGADYVTNLEDHCAAIDAIVAYLADDTALPPKQAMQMVSQAVTSGADTLFATLDDSERFLEHRLFLLAGAATTTIAMQILMRAWADDARALHSRATASGIRATVEHVLASSAPLGLATRFCAQDSDIRGQSFARGDIVHVNLADASATELAQNGGVGDSANLLVFGAGPHRCPGQHLALMELDLFLKTLLACESRLYAQRPATSNLPQNDSFRWPKGLQLVPQHQTERCPVSV